MEQTIKVPYESIVCENLSYKDGCEILKELQDKFNKEFGKNYIFSLCNQPEPNMWKICVRHKLITQDFIAKPEMFYLKRKT